MTTALGVSCDDDGNGVTPLTHRHIIGGFFQNTGIMDGLAVSGKSDLTYQVAAGVAVCSRGASDGKMLAYWPGGATTAVAAGDPSNPRIDVVWIRALNKPEYAADADNQVHVGVTQGVPAASPVKPTIPTDATEICRMLLPAGATATNAATMMGDASYALPYGATLGVLAENWDRRSFAWTADKGVVVREQKVTFTVPTDRLVRFCYKCNFSASAPTATSVSEWAMQFYLDGRVLDHSATNFVSHSTSWTTHETSYVAVVPAGTHTAEIGGWFGYGNKPNFHYNDSQSGPSGTWTGRRFLLVDIGASA